MTARARLSAVKDQHIRTAMGSFVPRAERAEDLRKLVATFVDSGIIDLVNNPRNQVIFGRRGTGKTHLLRFLESRFCESPRVVATYIDARTLGSSTLFSDMERPLHLRFVGLCKDVLSHLHNALFERLASDQEGNVDAGLRNLAEIEAQLTYTEPEFEEMRIRTADVATRDSTAGVGATIRPTGPSVFASLKAARSESIESEMESTTSRSPKLIFPAVFTAFRDLIDNMQLDRFVVLIDEWSSIPADLQPHFAELLNRAFFANRKVTIKIASLEFRSTFSTSDASGRKIVGLEFGGDIETAVDLDDFYVYDRDPAGTAALFANLLLKHVMSALDDEHYLRSLHGVNQPRDFTKLFFTQQGFKELVRSAEGVARDLLLIFSRAYTTAWRSGAEHITDRVVTAAARDWYESDKQSNLNDVQYGLLRTLMEEVIAGRQARSFLVRREDSGAPLLQSLIDQRVVHVIRKGYADKDNPGIRYNIYTLDYGCYVDLKGTKGEPQFQLSGGKKAGRRGEVIVPFDDNRRIRRIIVPRELLYPDSEGWISALAAHPAPTRDHSSRPSP